MLCISRFTHLNLGFLGVLALIAGIFIAVNPQSAIAKSISEYHLEVVKRACKELFPDSTKKKIKCRKKEIKRAGPLLGINKIEREGGAVDIKKTLVHCEGIGVSGHPAGRLKRYDKCLRDKLTILEEAIPTPPRFHTKPRLLFLPAKCNADVDKILASVRGNFYELSVLLERYVVLFEKPKNFISQFWCTNKELFFNKVLRGKGVDRLSVTLFLKTEKDFVQYELWDMASGAKFKGGNFRLDLDSKPTLVTARNLIITQIRKYCHNYSKEC